MNEANKISVRVKEMGGFNGPVLVHAGSTIRDVFAEANIKTDTVKTLRKNNEDADLSTVVNDNDLIYVVPNIKGNC